MAEIRGASTGTWCEPGVFDGGHCLLGSGVRAQGAGTGALREFGSSIGLGGRGSHLTEDGAGDKPSLLLPYVVMSLP